MISATVGNTVTLSDSRMRLLQRVVMVAAVAGWALVIAGAWHPVPHEHAAAHQPHAVAAAISDHFTPVMDHPHASDNSVPHSPDSFAIAVLPRAATTLTALFGLMLVVTCVALCGYLAACASRGPPRPGRYVLTGPSLLIRFCIARR